MITLEARLDLIELTQDNHISARFIIGYQAAGEFKRLGDGYHRLFLTPGCEIPEKFFCPDVSQLDAEGNAIESTLVTTPQKVFDAAGYFWTPEVIAAYQEQAALSSATAS